jgi:IS4 transposase
LTTISPAAVELHATMSVDKDQAIQISLAPDINGEWDFLPEANSLDQKLILSDRGSQDFDYCNEVEETGAAFVSRCKRNLNPTIVVADVDGKRRRGLEGKKLKNVRAKLKGKNADLIVQWPRYGDGFEPRLLFIWNPVLRCHMFLLTNLEAKEFSLHFVRQLYSLHWQVELLFKEWKS